MPEPKLFGTENVSRDFLSIFFKICRGKLGLIEDAVDINDLPIPPGNRLEALRGRRGGQYSIRINYKWGICFEWNKGNAYYVEIVDYH